MSKRIFEELSGPHRGHAAGKSDIEKQASQLAYDVKYKVKKSMSGATNMTPAQVSKAYLAQLAKSPAPAAVKTIAKKKLIGEEYLEDISKLVEKNVSNALNKVFVEGVRTENNAIEEEVEEKKYKIRVTDKKTGNTYVRMATRKKIAELRANSNISSVEMTSYGEVSADEKEAGKKTAAAKSGIDYDHDGVKESPAKEYRGAVHNAIQRRRGLKPDGKDTSNVKEELIYEKEEKKEKKFDVAKGVKNKVVVFPDVKEELNVQDKQKTISPDRSTINQVLLAKQKVDTAQKELANKQRMAAQKNVDLQSLSASYEPEGEDVQEVAPPSAKAERMVKHIKKAYAKDGKLTKKEKSIAYATAWKQYNEEVEKCAKCGESTCECDTTDQREIPTKMDLLKNKLRAKGIKVAGSNPAPRNMKTADDLGEELLDERRKQEKVAGTPRNDIGKTDLAYRAVKKTIRDMSGGRPAGQQKKEPGKKPPVAGEYGAPKSPAQKVAMVRAARKRSQDTMSSRYD